MTMICTATPASTAAMTLLVTDDKALWSHRHRLAVHGVSTMLIGSNDGHDACRTIEADRTHDVACVLVDAARRPQRGPAMTSLASQVLMHAGGAWHIAASGNISNTDACAPAIARQAARKSFSDLLRLIDACSRPGFVCVDHADLQMFFDAMHTRACRLVTARIVVHEHDAASAIDAWLRRCVCAVPVVDIALVLDVPATFPDLPALHRQLCRRMAERVAGGAPMLLPIVPFHPRMRAFGLRVTAFMLVAASPIHTGESA